MRLILAAMALIITRVDPSEPSRFVLATYTILAIYVGVSALVYLASMMGKVAGRGLSTLIPFLDLGVYVSLVGLSGGTNSVYFVLFFFSLLSVSFKWGYDAGIRITLVTVVLFVVVGYWMRPPEPEFDLNRFLIRASALPLLGYLIAFWGGYEVQLKSRLALLKEIASLSNPRFGIDRTLGMNLERIRAFFGVRSCLALLCEQEGHSATLWRSMEGAPESGMLRQPVDPGLSNQLMGFGEDEAVIQRPPRSSWRIRRGPACIAQARHGEPWLGADSQRCGQISEALETQGFVTVPFGSRSRLEGRLFLLDDNLDFRVGEVEFLRQVVQNLMPMLENIMLVDRMASRAAEDERHRIARDIHDRIIQPYIGLQMGITSMDQIFDTLPEEEVVPVLKKRTAKLLDLTSTGISDLREYVHQLRFGAAASSGFADILRSFSERFQEATGIRIEIRVEEGLTLNDRLAAELFPLITEGVSNIRKHTAAARGWVSLARKGEKLVVVIANEGFGVASSPAPFVPRSIAERAGALQGRVEVEQSESGETLVIVEIPL